MNRLPFSIDENDQNRIAQHLTVQGPTAMSIENAQTIYTKGIPIAIGNDEI
jgi:hypothetical protein